MDMSNAKNCCSAPQPAEQNCCPPGAAIKPVCCSSVPAKPEAGCCETTQSACGTAAPADPPGYSIERFVCGWLDSAVGKVPRVATTLDMTDHRGRWAMRWGLGRNRYRVTPGLYAVGAPDAEAPLLVSANYKLSFDCLRSALQGIDAWILVIDTKGVNVWCAAGKGTFGTAEIIRRCQSAQVAKIVNHRTLIVPQLGAPGVAAHLVKKATGFSVSYGPVRAADLPEFLAANLQATPAMRRVTFTFLERLILTPVEVSVLRKTILYAIAALFILSGIGSDIFSFTAAWQRGTAALVPGLAGILAGCVITPALLPWLPSRLFAAKGALVGLAIACLLALVFYRQAAVPELIALFLFVASIASYTAMNFTGSSTFTSPSGVEKEMRIALPWQAASLLIAGLLWIGSAF
jgi:hypothetical protein